MINWIADELTNNLLIQHMNPIDLMYLALYYSTSQLDQKISYPLFKFLCFRVFNHIFKTFNFTQQIQSDKIVYYKWNDYL